MGELTPRSGPQLTFYISDLLVNTSYTTVTNMPIGKLEIRRSLTEEEGLVYFTDDIKFTGALRWIFGLLLGRGFRAILPEVMNNFKRLVETENSGR